MLVKDWICDYFDAIGLTHVFGVSGANIEDLFFTLACRKTPQPVVAKTEYGAAMMAIGSYHASKRATAVLTTSGPGILNTVPVLAEAHAAGVPLVLIGGLIHQEHKGKGGFQDTSGKNGTLDLCQILAPCTGFLRKVTDAHQVPGAVAAAFRQANRLRQPCAVLIPRNLFDEETIPLPVNRALVGALAVAPHPGGDREGFAPFLHALETGAEPPLVVLGEELIHAARLEAVHRFIGKVRARVAVVPVAKGLFDHRSPSFLGIAGMMGHDAVTDYLERTDTVVLIGTRFDLLARYGLKLRGKTVLAVNEKSRGLAPLLGGARVIEVSGSIDQLLDQACEELRGASREPIPLRAASREAAASPGPDAITFRGAIAQIERHLEPGCDVFADAGNTGAFVTHHLNVDGRGIFYISLAMGGMGNSIGAALGACFATGKRSYVFLGDGAFLMHGLELHTAVEHRLPVQLFLFNNNSHGMCSTREEVFLGRRSGVNDFKPARFAAGLEHMFPGLACHEVGTPGELEAALRGTRGLDGPAVVSINLKDEERPPFRIFEQEGGSWEQTSKGSSVSRTPTEKRWSVSSPT